MLLIFQNDPFNSMVFQNYPLHSMVLVNNNEKENILPISPAVGRFVGVLLQQLLSNVALDRYTIDRYIQRSKYM